MKTLLIFVFTLSFSAVYAQADAILDVWVTDSTGRGDVRNAEIRLVMNDTVVMSDGGNLVRIKVKSGTETVIVSHPLLGSDTQVVTITHYGNAELRVKLPRACASLPVTDVCPKCRSNKNVINIVYGYPTPSTMKRAERGEIRLGGCMVDDCMPMHYCTAHKLEF